MTAPHHHDVRQALHGLDFPADREMLLSHATTRLAQPMILDALGTLPRGHYVSLHHVLDALPQRTEAPTESDEADNVQAAGRPDETTTP